MATNEEEFSEYSGTLRWIILVAVMLGTIMQVIDTSIVNVAIPTMMGNLGVTLDEIGWVSTGYIIANVIILPLTGWFSSTFGRRKYLTTSMVIFTASSFFCGTSHTLAQLIFFRVLQGAGGAALLSTAQATLLEIFPPWQQGMVQSIFGIGVMVGPTVGPTLGGWITDNYSWPWIFFINIPIGITASLLTFFFMHDSRHQSAPEGGVDVTGIGFLAVGLGCMQVVLEEGNTDDWFQSNFIIWMTVLSALGLVAFILWELHTKYPAVNLRVLKHRELAAGTIFGALTGFGLYGGIFILPVFLQDILGYTAQQTGLIMFPGAMATAFMMPIIGRLIGRFNPRNLAAIGVVGFIASMGLLHQISINTGPDQMYWALILRGASMGFLWLPITLATLSGLRGKDIAEGAGLYNLSRQLGGSTGIAFLSTFLDNRTSYHRAMLVENVTVYSQATMQRLKLLEGAMIAGGSSFHAAQMQALALIDQSVQVQATILAFEDAFLVVGIAFLFALPLLLLFRTRPMGKKDRSEVAMEQR
jgi:DHA2 family multidrug resistance protein